MPRETIPTVACARWIKRCSGSTLKQHNSAQSLFPSSSLASLEYLGVELGQWEDCWRVILLGGCHTNSQVGVLAYCPNTMEQWCACPNQVMELSAAHIARTQVSDRRVVQRNHQCYPPS